MITLPFHLRLASWTSLPFDHCLLLFFLIPVCVLLFITAPLLFLLIAILSSHEPSILGTGYPLPTWSVRTYLYYINSSYTVVLL